MDLDRAIPGDYFKQKLAQQDSGTVVYVEKLGDEGDRFDLQSQTFVVSKIEERSADEAMSGEGQTPLMLESI